MKKLALILSLIIFAASAAVGVGAYDYYGRIMPDYLFNAESITQIVSNGTSSNGMVYDDGRIYVSYIPDLGTAVPTDGTYAQAAFSAKVPAIEYRYIKVGYKGYIENNTEPTDVDINVGIDGIRFWGAKSEMTFDGEHREVIIDAADLTGGETYYGSANPGYDGINDDSVYTNVRFKPWGSHTATQVERTNGDYFKIEYIAFFGTEAEAEAYSTANYDQYLYTNARLAAYDFSITSMSMSMEHGADDSDFPYMRFIATTEPGEKTPENMAINLNMPNSAGLPLDECDHFLLCYRTNIKNSSLIDFNIGTSYGTGSARIWGPKLSYTADGEFNTILVDLSSLKYTGGAEGYYEPDEGETIWSLVNDITYLRIKPYNSAVSLEGEYFDILYYGLFADEEEALAFVPELPEGSFIRGDANADFLVDPADEIKFARMLTDPELTYNNVTSVLDINRDDIISVADHVILARHIAGWRDYQSIYTKTVDESYTDALNEEFEARKEEILNSESEWTVKSNKSVYYISPDGDDSNDGLSEDTPWKTTANIKSSILNSGDVVLFERGSVWREKFNAVGGVTYSAYGEGAKPAFYGSVDGASSDYWEEVYDNVWKFTARTFDIVNEDVGCIIFNEGEAYGARVLTDEDGNMVSIGKDGLTSNGLEQWVREAGSYADETALSHDLEYFLNPDSGYVYVYCEGNPADRFYSIELATKGNIIRGYSGCTFDNLTIKYGASHGIGMGSVSNVTVRNCEVGWIGGAIQNYTSSVTGRYGNGIEIYGSANGFYVYNNYVYECFDCGVTVQRQGSISEGTTVTQFNCFFYDNIVERCNSPLEQWLTHPDEPTEDTYAYMNNVIFERNLCRRSGWGFGGYIHTKTDNNMFYGGYETNAVMTNSFIQNNIMWDIRNLVILAYPTTTNYGKGMIWKDNTIIKEYDTVFVRTARNLAQTSGGYMYWDYNDKVLTEFEVYKILGDNNYLSFLP